MSVLSEFCKQACGDPCRSVFDRVVVRYYTTGGTLVMWQLRPEFDLSGPLRFQLQVGSTSNPLADDWKNVGLPVVDQFFAIDPDQRDWSKRRRSFYRVRLTVNDWTFYSTPTSGMELLTKREWLLAREILRQRLKMYRKGYAAQEGLLLKRRLTGQRCPSCLDFQTEEIRNPDCSNCFGTGFRCGYYYPISCVYALMSEKRSYTRQDSARGTVDDQQVRAAEMVLVDMMETEDVFVSLRTDDRYWIHSVASTAEVRGVPIVGKVELRLIPFSSPIYNLPVQETWETWNRIVW